MSQVKFHTERKLPHPLTQGEVKDQIHGLELTDPATSGIPIHLLHLLPQALTYAQLRVFGENFPQLTTRVSAVLSLVTAIPVTGRLLLIDPHFHDLWISISHLQVIPCGTECLSPCSCCGCIVCYIIMGKHLSTAWIKRKDRNRQVYEEWEQNTHTHTKKTWNNWITLKRKFPREINGEINLL